MTQLRSSPGPKTGCSTCHAIAVQDPLVLRSSPGPKTGCSLDGLAVVGKAAHVAILTRSEDRVQLGRNGGEELLPEVAILTRSEDRVQPALDGDGDPADRVAILTRSEDRVQRRRMATA